MDYPEIAKQPSKAIQVQPNLVDLNSLGSAFDWKTIEAEIGIENGRMNLADIAIDRHARGGSAGKTALIWESKEHQTETYTFADLSALTSRFANVLAGLGVAKGDRVFTFMERYPELYVSIFGALKLGAIAGPLFADFGPDPVRDRLRDSGAKVLVTSPALKSRIESLLPELPELKHVIVVNRADRTAQCPGEVNYFSAMASASPQFDSVRTGQDDYSLMHYTSGTTGRPKGAVHVHRAGIQHYATGKWVLDLHPDDIYWCTADPGWVTGTSYGMLAPWTNGVTQVVYEGGFWASGWYSIIQKYKVNVWYTAPTALRMLAKAGAEVAQKHDLSSLRHVCSVGEPLNPEVIMWAFKTYGLPVHDNWWQTETGAIMIANYAAMPVRPGSMGRPSPGIAAAIIKDNGEELPPGQEGHLAIKTPWPSMFRSYWNNDKLYQSRFQNGWYITGDRAYRDSDGYFWFVGREDDVIKSAGHLIGPFEVESALLEHPAVAEAGVIGKPDPIAMEVVKAFVSLKPGFEASPALKRELMQFTRKKLAAAAAPRDLEIVASLPKTRSGKIMRRLLKARELGLPLGDTSTLEDY